jgi:hypothetical protein
MTRKPKEPIMLPTVINKLTGKVYFTTPDQKLAKYVANSIVGASVEMMALEEVEKERRKEL